MLFPQRSPQPTPVATTERQVLPAEAAARLQVGEAQGRTASGTSKGAYAPLGKGGNRLLISALKKGDEGGSDFN